MRVFVFVLFIVALMGCSDDDPVATGPKLKSVTTYLLNSSGQFRPGEKTEYQYAANQKLIKDTQWQYDIADKAYYLFSTSDYSYSGGRLVRIEKKIDQSDKIITTFEYENGRVSKIKEDNESSVDTEAVITYLPDDRVEITYTQSNGRWFVYRFTFTNGNKIFEQVMGDDEQLSSEVTHEFDSGKNPLALLGYTDLFFTTVSANNKIKTESNFIKAPYPQSTPVSYSYEYTESGYPSQQITTYQSLGASYTTRVKVVYEYQ